MECTHGAKPEGRQVMKTTLVFVFSVVLAGLVLFHQVELAQSADPGARDPGVRKGVAGAGAPLRLLSPSQLAFFQAGKEDFEEDEGEADGLGQTMNLDSCVGCHSQPA